MVIKKNETINHNMSLIDVFVINYIQHDIDTNS